MIKQDTGAQCFEFNVPTLSCNQLEKSSLLMFNTKSGKAIEIDCFVFRSAKAPDNNDLHILISFPQFSSSCFHTVNLTAVYLFPLEHLPSRRSAHSKIVWVFHSISSVQKFRFWPPAHQDVSISQTSLGKIAFFKNILHSIWSKLCADDALRQLLHAIVQIFMASSKVSNRF